MIQSHNYYVCPSLGMRSILIRRDLEYNIKAFSVSTTVEPRSSTCNNAYTCIFVCIHVVCTLYICTLYYIILERSHTIGGLTNNGQTDRQTDGHSSLTSNSAKNVCAFVYYHYYYFFFSLSASVSNFNFVGTPLFS